MGGWDECAVFSPPAPTNDFSKRPPFPSPPPPSRTLQNSMTRSGPNVTRPGPRGLGWTPSTASLVVGSDQSRSMRTMPPSSMVSGRCRAAIWSMWEMDRPMPPCMHRMRSSIRAARGR